MKSKKSFKHSPSILLKILFLLPVLIVLKIRSNSIHEYLRILNRFKNIKSQKRKIFVLLLAMKNNFKITIPRYKCINGGQKEIRTLGTENRTPVFKTGAFNRSAICPLFTREI